MILGIEFKAVGMLDKYIITNLHLQPYVYF